MIDIETYRTRIGQFRPNIRKRKCFYKQENYCWYGKHSLLTTKFVCKILMLSVLLCGSHAPASYGRDPDSQLQLVGGYSRSVHSGADHQGVHCAGQFLCWPRGGKKATNNFRARYLYGNRQKKGIINIHLNIRSLRNKVMEVKNIVKDFSPHILGLSECELRKENCNESILKIPGYNILFPKSWEVHGFARVLVYVRKTLQYEQVHDLQDPLVQSVWLRGSFRNSRKIYYCHGYREHLSTLPFGQQRDYLSKFLAQWEAAVEHNFSAEPNEVHVSLDMNLDSYNGRWLQGDYRLLALSRLVQSTCNSSNFSQLVQEPTRSIYNSVNNTTEVSCIDHIYCNARFKCSSPVVTSFGASDHDIISYTRYSKEPPTPSRTIRRRSYKNFIPEHFINDMAAVDWSDVYACKDLEQAVDIFTRKFRQVLNLHAPWIAYQQRKNFSPWLTRETKELITQRDMWKQRAKDLAIASPDVVSEEQREAWSKFKNYRNKVNNKKKSDEQNYKREKIEENIEYPNKTWRTAKQFMNWKSPGSPTQILDNGTLIKKAVNIAECMNSYFVDKVKSIRNGMRSVAFELNSCYQVMAGKTCTLGLSHVTEQKVGSLIRSLSNSKSLAVDELDNYSVKIAADSITKPLHHIITLSLLQQRFPSQWKFAKIIPLHKKESLFEKKNYRPVAILSPLSKILERIVFEQVYSYFSRNRIFHPNVHGYRQNRSTLTALLQLYDRWVHAAAKGQVSGAVLLDLSAAFDLVPPEILLKKLEVYGLQTDFTAWIQSYLTDRHQSVWIDHTMSGFLPCEVGVPQGSNLGPLFFLIFVNDLPFILDCELEQYADDSTLSVTDPNITIINQRLTRSCESVSKWMGSNQLKLNPDKTHVLTLGTDRRLAMPGNQVSVTMDGVRLLEDADRCETLLGCVMQADLKWHQQITLLKSKLKKRLAGLGHVKFILPYNTRKVVCEGMFNSVLAYCLPLFGGCDVQEIKELQILQNKVARIVLHAPFRANRQKMFDDLKWLTVKQLIMYHTLLTVFRVRSTGEPEYLAAALCRDNNYGKIIVPHTTLSLYMKSFTIRGACNWNSLPASIRQCRKIGPFKKDLRAWIEKQVPRFLD